MFLKGLVNYVFKTNNETRKNCSKITIWSIDRFLRLWWLLYLILLVVAQRSKFDHKFFYLFKFQYYKGSVVKNYISIIINNRCNAFKFWPACWCSFQWLRFQFLDCGFISHSESGTAFIKKIYQHLSASIAKNLWSFQQHGRK